jgi:myosin-5
VLIGKYFARPRKVGTQFVVNHYAGPVEYESIGFVEKNADPVDLNVNKVLAKSELSVISSLFKFTKAKTAAKPPPGGTRASVAGGKNQLGKQTICINFLQ